MVVDRGLLVYRRSCLPSRSLLAKNGRLQAPQHSTTNSQPLPFGHSPLLCSSPINPVLPDIERCHPRAIDPEYHSEIRFDDSRINRVFRSRR